jgi:hypothetical protein
MIRHVVLFRWKEGTPEEARQAVRDGLAELPDAVGGVRRYEFGDDAGLADGNFDFAVVADFDDAAAYAAYAGHERHQALIRERIRPHLAERVAVQFQI